MPLAFFTADRYASRYGLLGEMSREIGAALLEAGHLVNPTGTVRVEGAAHVFMNFPDSFEALSRWAGIGPGRAGALINVMVDHPFAFDPGLLTRLAALPGYRLAMPCLDDTHLLRLRWPTLKHVHVMHGVPASSVCDERALEAGHMARAGGGRREIDLLVAGSIHAPNEVAALRERVPAPLRGAGDEMVRAMLARPWMSLGQALELSLPTGVHASDQWLLMRTMWQYVTAALNRERRVALVRAMQGIGTTVIGGQALEEHCTGTIRYAGEAAYAELAPWFARARVCLAWGPTQFVHSFSERLLLAMGGGCACVADDRELVARQFGRDGTRVRLFDAADPDAARHRVHELLSDPSLAWAVAGAGREAVASGHLWAHRVAALVGLAMDAGRAASRAA